MDPLAVRRIRLKEIIRALEDFCDDDPGITPKASLELKKRLRRLRLRLDLAAAGFSMETTRKVLSWCLREVVEIVLKLGIEAFIRSTGEVSWNETSLVPCFEPSGSLAA